MKNRYLAFLSSVVFDFFAAALSLLASLKLVGTPELTDNKDMFVFSVIVWPMLIVLSLYIFKAYSVLWRFSRIPDLLRVFAGVTVAFGGLFICQMAVFGRAYSLPVMLLAFSFTFFLAVMLRLLMKYTVLRAACESGENAAPSELDGNIMIIGAGSAASMLINELKGYKPSGIKFKCIIDDDPSKKNTYISGVKVCGDRNHIIEAAEKYEIDTILFAIPSCGSKERSEILNICKETSCRLKIVPSVYQMICREKSSISDKIRKVEIEDLLGREPISLDIDRVMNYVAGKTVLVTGGGGTIGSELCRQIAEHKPKRLIVFDVYENNAYDIQNELKRKYPKLDLVTLIGSVRDSKRLECMFNTYRPDIVYHAAAHKHVPLMEDSPNEAVKNNVFGTLKTARCADKYGAEKFVLISTDKAVNPTNIMGASKRICEMIIQAYNNRSETEFVAVRFGNVLGSNGSVIPLFKKQIEAGGPVTVTDPDIIRYFMTIPEAVTLVLQAGASAKGGEIFVLDMGKPMKILDLAENLIRLSGLVPYKDINIEFIGLRPGEKLYEEMLMDEEGIRETENELIYIGHPIELDEENGFDLSQYPAVTLVRAGDETMWELAKEYHSSVEKISAANQTEDAGSAGLLLIPKCV